MAVKIIDSTNLGYLISKIKAAFWPKTDVVEVGELDIDSTPTSGSGNLVSSSGVYNAIGLVKQDVNVLLEHVDWSGLTVVYRFIDPSNKWASGNNPRCVFVPLVPGKKYSVKYETSGTIAILQDNSSTIGETPNWATGFVGRIVITDEYNFVAPPDAHYMYLLTGYNGVVYTPEYITALENGSVTDVTLGGVSVVSQGVAVLPAYPTVPTNVSAFTNDAHYLKYYLCADEAEYNAIQNKDSGTLYLIPES